MIDIKFTFEETGMYRNVHIRIDQEALPNKIQ